MSWHDITFGDAIHVKHGFAFKSQHFSDNGEYIVLTPGNFNEEGGFKLRPGKDRFYKGNIPEDYILEEGDLIIAMTEQGPGLLGSSALISDSDKFLHNQRLGLIQDIDETILDKKYLYYLFNTRSVRGQIRGSATGTKVKHTAPERIYRVKTTVPSEVNEQKKIASILSAYDDLIENNRRRIQLLEQAARLLYKEWFMHLRFPGHEHVTITDGVPGGWEKKTIGKCFETVLGGTPSRKNLAYWAGDVPWINSGEVNKTRIFAATEFITEEGLSKSAAKVMPAGTTVLAVTGATLGQVSRLEIECSANQSVIGIYDKIDLQNEWLYLLFIHEIRKIINHATGGAQQHINKEIVNTTEFLQPKQQLLVAFREEVAPIFDQIRNVGLQNIALSKARDILLPRLMNGEVAV